EEFAIVYPNHAKTLNEEYARMKPQSFDIIFDRMLRLSQTSHHQLDEIIQNKLREVQDILTQYVPNNNYYSKKMEIHQLQVLFKKIALKKGCFLFNEQQTFGRNVYK